MTGVSMALTVEEEIKLGSEAAAKFEEEHGLVSDQAMVDRLQRIGARLLVHAQRKDLPWRLRVVDVDAVNAAAFPGGFLYATKGLMEKFTDEELAFVIGHEIGHVDFRHSVRRIEKSQKRRLGLIAIAAGVTRGRIGNRASRIIQLTDSVIGSRHSQGAESESDHYGMTTMALAGYDPIFALRGLDKLAAQRTGGTPGFLNTLVGSHPLPKDRISKGAELVLDIPFRPHPGLENTSSAESPIFHDATESLEFTFSQLGYKHDESLQNTLEKVATGRLKLPFGQYLVFLAVRREEGFSGLERALLAQSALQPLGQAFGALVREAPNGDIQGYVLLEGRN